MSVFGGLGVFVIRTKWVLQIPLNPQIHLSFNNKLITLMIKLLDIIYKTLLYKLTIYKNIDLLIYIYNAMLLFYHI